MKQRWTVIPAVFVVFRRRGEVLLLRRANTGYRDGWFSLPAGHLDGGETAASAAAREAQEEVGVTVAAKSLKLVHTLHRVAEEGSHERIDLFFETTDWLGEPQNMEPHKCDELRWVPFEALPGKIIPSVGQALGCIQNGIYYSESNFEPARAE